MQQTQIRTETSFETEADCTSWWALMSSRVFNKNQADASILFWAGLAWILVAQFWQYSIITMAGWNCYFAWKSKNQKAVSSDFFFNSNIYFTKRTTIILGTLQIQISSKWPCKEQSVFNNGTLLCELGKYHPAICQMRSRKYTEKQGWFSWLTQIHSQFSLAHEKTASLYSHFFIHDTKKEWQIQSLFENLWFWVIKGYWLKCKKFQKEGCKQVDPATTVMCLVNTFCNWHSKL